MSTTKETVGIKAENVNQATVNEVVPAVQEPKENHPFTDNKELIQRTSSTFGENLHRISEAAGIDACRDVKEETSHSWAGIHTGRGQWRLKRAAGVYTHPTGPSWSIDPTGCCAGN
jgi:hypothetical protein